MGLDINLYKVLTKSEVTKLKNKYDVTDLVYPEKDNCEELDKIYFIEIEALINCDTNIETLNNFKHCLIEKEMTYYDEIKIFNHKEKKLGLYIKDVEYIQRKGIKITKRLTGKCYTDNISRLFISTKSQLEKLNKNNIYKDCKLKRNFKIPKNHLLYIDW